MALSKNLDDESFEKNGLKIKDTNNFEKELRQYLYNKKCLSVCKYCLGTTGKLFPIEQVSREQYKKLASRKVPELIDEKFLAECLNNDVGDMRTVGEVIEI